jgi:hypothetical protein
MILVGDTGEVGVIGVRVGVFDELDFDFFDLKEFLLLLGVLGSSLESLLSNDAMPGDFEGVEGPWKDANRLIGPCCIGFLNQYSE